jgi:hypothetical protein
MSTFRQAPCDKHFDRLIVTNTVASCSQFDGIRDYLKASKPYVLEALNCYFVVKPKDLKMIGGLHFDRLNVTNTVASCSHFDRLTFGRAQCDVNILLLKILIQISK